MQTNVFQELFKDILYDIRRDTSTAPIFPRRHILKKMVLTVSHYDRTEIEVLRVKLKKKCHVAPRNLNECFLFSPHCIFWSFVNKKKMTIERNKFFAYAYL